MEIETRTDNRRGFYFIKKSVKIYYTTILNNNRKRGAVSFTVVNGQSNEFTSLVNVKSELK